MIEKEYVVVVKKGIDLNEIDSQLSSTIGNDFIPDRSVDIANARLGSKRMTHWYLTDEEANKLSKDPRIESVEIPVEHRDDVQIGKRAVQQNDFTKTATLDNTKVNWGLRRCIEDTNIYSNNLEASGNYEYALDGTGVDIVIQDSGIQADHPDFFNYSGTSRVQQIDWYTESGLSGTQSANHYRDFDGHGTHCAGISAGLTYGWAKNANIYAQKLAGLEGTGDTGTGIPVADAFDAIRLWHAAKTNGRPTVVNMSWGYFTSVTGDPTSGNYRGTGWVWGVDYSNDLTLWSGTGVVIPLQGTTRFLPSRIASVDAEIDDMIAAGIHVFIAAGNDYFKGDISTGNDYNNTVVFGGLTYNYHRGSSPNSDDAIKVGNADDDVQLDGGEYKDKVSNSTSRGPNVDIFAPGTNIISTASNTSIYATTEYPLNTNFNIAKINGTSMACPQVAGVACQHLQSNPNLTPAQLKARIINDSKSVMFSTGSDTDYNLFATSLMGAPNRFLYSKYGTQPIQINDGANFQNIGIDLST